MISAGNIAILEKIDQKGPKTPFSYQILIADMTFICAKSHFKPFSYKNPILMVHISYEFPTFGLFYHVNSTHKWPIGYFRILMSCLVNARKNNFETLSLEPINGDNASKIFSQPLI